MLALLLIILLLLAIFGGFALSKLIWILAVFILIALLFSAFSGSWGGPYNRW